MPEPAFLVEGQMEQAIIQRICHGMTVRLIGCNGKDVNMTVMAKALNARMLRLKNYHPIIILFDREKRLEGRVDLLSDLSSRLDNLGHKGRYILGMPDRTTEVWTLSDWSGVCAKNPGLEPYSGPIEGQNGKSIIKSLLPEDVIYHETTLGVELFCSTRSNILYSTSQSFKALLDQIQFPCHWAIPIAERFQPTYTSEL